jgi:hypothetical protein
MLRVQWKCQCEERNSEARKPGKLAHSGGPGGVKASDSPCGCRGPRAWTETSERRRLQLLTVAVAARPLRETHSHHNAAITIRPSDNPPTNH